MELWNEARSQVRSPLSPVRPLIRFYPLGAKYPPDEQIEEEDRPSALRTRATLSLRRKDQSSEDDFQFSHLFYLKGSRSGIKISVIVDGRNRSYIQKSAANLEMEYSIQSRLEHPHVVKTVLFMTEEDVDFIVMEHCVNGDLLDRLKTKGGLSEKTARRVMGEVVEALAFCHNCGVVHSDVKPENFFFDSNFIVKLGDFGHSRRADDGLIQDWQLGTQDYMAPEMHVRGEYDGFRADVFSAGIVLFMLLTAHRPFSRALNSDQTYRLLQSNSSLFWSLHQDQLSSNTHRVTRLPQAFTELVTAMLQEEPDLRPSWEDIRTSEWMRGEQATREEAAEELRD